MAKIEHEETSKPLSPPGLGTQEANDASRKPLTEEERMVYAVVTRQWLPARILGEEEVLNRLVDKGWVDYTRQGGEWVYQRRHSLDGY